MERGKFLKWVIKKGFVDQVGFSSHGSYKLIENAINCEVFSFCNLHLHFLDQSKNKPCPTSFKKENGCISNIPC